MKARISYQHVTGHSGYDREWAGEGTTLAEAVSAAVTAALAEKPHLKLPEKLSWENRVSQGDGMVTVLYDF